MNILEYQAKSLLQKYRAPIPRGKLASSAEEAQQIAKELGGDCWAVKAQIAFGGRGKAGGIKIARSLEEVEDAFRAIHGKVLQTEQTGGQKVTIDLVYIEQGCAIVKEYYLSCLIDRRLERVVFLISTEGGVDIEETAQTAPEKIITIPTHPILGCQSYHCYHVARALGLEGNLAAQARILAASIHRAFIDNDATLIEINPLVTTSDDRLVCLDAKMGFDNNALFRHQDLLDYAPRERDNTPEAIARKYDLSYIQLDGSIGCMVNGAGLAMATMDIIKLHGAKPANFLDVGGGATKEKVAIAFKIILSDENVKSILINIFGGIMRCDIIAEGIIEAVKEHNLTIPLIVRLQGTNVAKGKELLAQSGLRIIPAENLSDAAQKAVSAAKEVR